ncbi:ankyrin repeat domain-containing protein [Candidatus Bathyarchaeota archaeon]|nr:ankyrin repeat domain-containing protein [Candidatus Bathyarchaeota archaeon]
MVLIPDRDGAGNADIRLYFEDASGWSPLMIAANVPDSEEVLRILLGKDPDVNQKSA